MATLSISEVKSQILGKLRRHYGRGILDCTRQQLFKTVALTIRDLLAQRLSESRAVSAGRELHYLSMEFLLGRSLAKNTFNLELSGPLRAAIVELLIERPDSPGEFTFDDFLETEPDANLGNGGLGRLAACYLDSMTTLGLCATGYTICYEYGIFKQKIIDGQQAELPDPWLDIGDCWLIPHVEEAVTVRFGGKIEERWEDGNFTIAHTDYSEVLAVPKDMLISGYKSDRVNRLRLWDSQSPVEMDMPLFSSGQYIKSMEQQAMASVIAKVLYPDDNHFEGKLLRLRQQYFFVSATVQDITRSHKEKYGFLRDFHLRHVLHINDTHPALVIPELMRILLDEEKLNWEEAWSVTKRSVAYTNHTVMSEALERWPAGIVEMLLPRLWRILCEINDRYISDLRSHGRDEYAVSQMAVIWDGEVRMANLCAYACFAVNGVSVLHSGILRRDIFRNQYASEPTKFFNVTNGVDHRRWLAQINPELHSLIMELIGDNYLSRPAELERLEAFTRDDEALDRLAGVKDRNKAELANRLRKSQGLAVDPRSIFDAQVKRLHEYKRQLLNVLHILYLYNRIADSPGSIAMRPRTFFFGAKAASGYHMAKRIVRLIGSVAHHISRHKTASKLLQVVFLENYRVSVAEKLMPAAEISEQISLAGMEASGTGNMKFMMNGALTVGTLDGANVEMRQFVGEGNIFIFGLTADEVEKTRADGYSAAQFYSHNEELRRVLDMLSGGLADGESYSDITHSLLLGGNAPADPYLVLADFEAYCAVKAKTDEVYGDRRLWNQMSLRNIAASGAFAADRSVKQYAEYIWGM
ncbi:MAG: glycogen/starch/alpha-glucan phosphorylase [Oscillospiraceae bacterium]|jgi:starch phosphorylase|nr:glycogen/starch/alpha-glucan phosphorylase [Oscillospiraceae bacterium]